MFFDKSGLLEHSWYRVTKATLKSVRGYLTRRTSKFSIQIYMENNPRTYWGPCFLRYHEILNNLGIATILSKYRRILEISEELKPITDSKTLVVQKRATNLKQLLTRADINPQQIEKGSSPCGKTCAACPFLQGTDHITSWKTKEKIKIQGCFNCKTKNVIYIISCKKCGLQYVGQSSNTFQERFRGHLADIRQGNNVKPVSCHFTSVNVTIVAQTTDNLNIRLRTEETWISRLGTKHPSGLNLIQ